MRELVTTVEIDAPAERVWAVLTDFPAYQDWNPFIVRSEGQARPGARLTNRMRPPGRRAVTFRPRVLVAEPNRELRWLGRLLAPGLFDGEHYFRLEPAGPGRVRLTQGERFRGVLAPLLWRRLEAPTRQGFQAMNAALKTRAEGAGA